jgi:hypothetical protein
MIPARVPFESHNPGCPLKPPLLASKKFGNLYKRCKRMTFIWLDRGAHADFVFFSAEIMRAGVDKASSDVFLWMPQLLCLQT